MGGTEFTRDIRTGDNLSDGMLLHGALQVGRDGLHRHWCSARSRRRWRFRVAEQQEERQEAAEKRERAHQHIPPCLTCVLGQCSERGGEVTLRNRWGPLPGLKAYSHHPGGIFSTFAELGYPHGIPPRRARPSCARRRAGLILPRGLRRQPSGAPVPPPQRCLRRARPRGPAGGGEDARRWRGERGCQHRQVQSNHQVGGYATARSFRLPSLIALRSMRQRQGHSCAPPVQTR